MFKIKCNANVERLRGYKIRIYPTDEQKDLIQKYINGYRAVYNLGLEIQNKNHENGNSYIRYFDMAKLFSDMRNNCIEYYWLNDIPISMIRQSLLDLDHAFKIFFEKRSNYPNFKSKKKSKKSFSTRSERCHSFYDNVKISGIGRIDAKSNPIPINNRLYNTSISFDGYNYYFSCQIETDLIDMSEVEVTEPVGLDLGIRNLITSSDGDVYKLSDTKKYEKRLKRQDRRLQKDYKKYLQIAKCTITKYEDIPKSKNMQKRLKAKRKTCDKITNKHKTDIHTATKRIVDKNPSAIVLEDLKTSKIIKSSSPWINKYAPYMYFYEIRRQIEYKALDRGIPVYFADPQYPSSQICSNCGHSHKVYGNKKFICPICGLRIDRDLNAAYNLRNLVYTKFNSTC